MKKTLFYLHFLLIIINNSFAQSDSLTMIYENYIKALGGQENLDKIQSVKMYSANKVGTNVSNTMKMSEITYKLRPNYLRKELLSDTYGLVITCFYMDSSLIWDNNTLGGKTMHTWQATQKVTGRTPKMKINSQKPLFYNYLVQYKEMGYKASYKNISTVKGKPCYVIDVAISSTAIVHYYIDCETFLLIREHFEDLPNSIQRYYENYKIVNGVLFAFTVLSEGRPSIIEEYEKIEINISIDPRLFDCVPLPKEDKKD